MGKSTATVVAVLALLTGFVLGQLESLAVPRLDPAPSNPAASARALAATRSFYDKVNEFLVSGDRAVESMLVPGFVDHTSSLPTPRNAEELMAGLTAARAALPHLQLKVADVQDQGMLVAVQIEIDPGKPSDIPAFPDVAYPPGRTVEFLRIEHSSVAERWSNDDRFPGVAVDMHTDFEHDGPSLSGPAIERLSLAAGQSVELDGRDTVVLQVISGQLQIGQTGVGQRGEAHPSSEPLDAGQLRILEVKDSLQLRNRSSGPVEFWAFSLYGLYPAQSSPSNNATPVAAPNVETSTLAYMPLQLPGSLPDRLRLSVAQVTLPAGAWVVPHTPGVVEQITVLDGALEASLQTGRALLCTGDNRSQPFDGVETAAAGQGFSANSAATLSYRVSSAQPAILLIMTIDLAPSPSEPDGAGDNR